jgi:amidohydrolase
LDPKEAARLTLSSIEPQLIEMSHRIHANPELSFQEERASAWLCEALDHAGFRVERGVCGLPTAFLARAGRGPLSVAVCAEYDALPGVGHACGHNVIAAAALGAGLILAPIADDLGLTVSLTGTPAEEGGGGKIIMLERGAFDGVNAAMMVHPYPYELPEMPTFAASIFEVHYYGKEAHASAFPEQGINAADALTVAQTSIGLLRQHLRDTDRVHGIVTRGGDAPNIIPAHTSAGYMVRGKTLSEMEEVLAKVVRCFEAGALATGARFEMKAERPYAELATDEGMTDAYVRNAGVLHRTMLEMTPAIRKSAASTDMGNVSHVIPSIHPAISVESYPVSNHQPEFAAYAASAAGDKAMLDGALLMAWTAIDMASDAAFRSRLEQKRFSRP